MHPGQIGVQEKVTCRYTPMTTYSGDSKKKTSRFNVAETVAAARAARISALERLAKPVVKTGLEQPFADAKKWKTPFERALDRVHTYSHALKETI